MTFVLSIEGFVKIARISTMTIPDRQKLSELYHDDTFMIMESYWPQYLKLWRCQVIPTDTRFVRYCLVLLGIGKYGSIVLHDLSPTILMPYDISPFADNTFFCYTFLTQKCLIQFFPRNFVLLSKCPTHQCHT